MATDNQLIMVGANVSDLSALFGLDRKEVRVRIGDIPPRGKIGGNEVWRVRDVAPRLARIDDNMTDMVRRVLATHHTDLPKMLSKEFWYGQNQRLKYMRDVGDLWDTGAVVTLASEVFKTLRLSLMLASDAVERETDLTEAQRQIIENIIHEALNDAREKLVVSLNGARERTQGKAFTPKENFADPGLDPDSDVDEWGDRVGRDPRPGDDDYL